MTFNNSTYIFSYIPPQWKQALISDLTPGTTTYRRVYAENDGVLIHTTHHSL